MHQPGVVLLVEGAAFVAKGVPAASDDPFRPHAHFIVLIVVIAAGRRSIDLIIMKLVILKLHIFVPLEVQVCVGDARTRLRASIPAVRRLPAVLDGRARHESPTSYFTKTIMPHLTFEATSPLLAIRQRIAAWSVLPAISSRQQALALSAFLVPQERTRLLPSLRARGVLALADHLVGLPRILLLRE